ncbi:hypothetical protein DRE_00952 [Drechslerella stenobrocha 248]|uniref:Uncharacterized protein n=1 Tax=Drechslerella stenobrocha 248 TaxID=1043628 RepID=W7HY73_9PEZI|nr:hypothetical protein DRE_00952 [Drechslerella stenobrocha 248]
MTSTVEGAGSLPVDYSPCSSVLSLSGELPMARSIYSEKGDIFDEFPLPPQPVFDKIYFLAEPPVTTSDTFRPDIQSIKDLGVSLTREVRRLWVKWVRRTASDEISEPILANTGPSQGVAEFLARLQAVTDTHTPLQFIFDGSGHRIPFSPEDFFGLDAALEDAISSSRIFEADDREMEESGFIIISLGRQQDRSGAEIKFAILENADMEDQLEQWPTTGYYDN